MTELFGIPLEQILVALALGVGLAFLVLAWVGVRNPLLLRMGLRNAARRKTQTVLIVLGLMLSTLIISAAFATGDTVAYSVTNAVYRSLNNVDVVVVLAPDRAPGLESLDDSHVESLRRMLGNDADVDGVTGVSQVRVPVVHQAKRLSEPAASIVGLDPATVAPFDVLTGTDGTPVSLAALPEGRVLITERLAQDVGARPGDTITLYYENEPVEVTVQSVILDNRVTAPGAALGPGSGAGGPGGGGGDGSGALSGGIVTTLERVRAITGREGRLTFIALSATGGTRDHLDRVGVLGDRVTQALETSGAPMRVLTTKAAAVSTAELVGSLFVTFFVVFGLFSMAAGIMLIFLTFVMLAAERRSEMGMARAVGMQRAHLTQSFIAEGMAYNIGSALVGALLGLGVAYGLVTVMGRLIEGFGLNIEFHFNPVGFAIAYCLGVVITFVTVGFASWRAANLNIVRAIRDIPEPQPLRGRDRGIGGLMLATLGVAWYASWLVVLGVLALVVTAVTAFLASLSWIGVAIEGGASLLLLIVAWPAVRRFLGGFGGIARAAKRHRNGGGWAVWMLLVGLAAVAWGGWVSQQAFAYTSGITLVLLAVAMLAVYFGAPSRPAFTVASLLLIWFWLLPLPFSLLVAGGETWTDPLNGLARLVGLEHPDIESSVEMFFVSGLSITAAATLLVIFNAEVLLGAVRAMSAVFGSIAPAIRTAIAYPLASKFRTAMTLAMFALVMFSLVVMATLNHNFTQIFLGADATGGFDVFVQANANNRIPDLREALTAAEGDPLAGVEAVGTLTSKRVRARAGGQPVDLSGTYTVQGADAEFLRSAVFPLATRAEGYDSDAAVLEALRTDPSLAIVDESRLAVAATAGGPGGGPPFGPRQTPFRLTRTLEELQTAPWAPLPIIVRDPAGEDEVPLRVIGVVRSQATSVISQWNAVIVNDAVVREALGGGESETYYLVTASESPAATKRTADAVEAALVERGVQAASIQARIEERAAQANAFQMLFQGFMGLGLIVGIAALGVIAFRSVAERRQQIGMLRAIGYTRRLVALSFFLESSFIALTGIGMGLVLGAALSYNLMTSPTFTEGAEIDFGFPWSRLIFIIAVAYGASALMTLIPARSASRVPVAEALRYNG
ncbi:MAG: ABC transporter permease [Dehalococcoidia bacterium]